MKILLVANDENFNKDNSGGVARYVNNLYNNLSRMALPDSVEKRAYNVRLFLPSLTQHMLFELKTACDDFDGFDIIHLLSQFPFSKVKMRKNVVISTAHDFWALLYPKLLAGLSPYEKIVGKLNWGVRSTLKADYIIANSSQTREEAIRCGFESRNVFVANHGVDRRFLSTTRAPRKNEEFTVGLMTGGSFKDNPELAIDAFLRVRDKHVKFNVYGSLGSKRGASLKKKAAPNSNIRFKGFIEEENLISTYDHFDAYVEPTRHDGFGLQILEAQARGVPVIVHKKGMIPKETRRYCVEARDADDIADVIQKLKDNGYNEKLRKRATAYARSFTWERNALETLRIYRRIKG